jgi:hypothetical protein
VENDAGLPEARYMPIPVNTFVREIRVKMRTEPTLSVLSQPPTTCTKRHSVYEATDSILVTIQNANAFAFQRVPDITCPVIVTTKQNTARDGESEEVILQRILLCVKVFNSRSARMSNKHGQCGVRQGQSRWWIRCLCVRPCQKQTQEGN